MNTFITRLRLVLVILILASCHSMEPTRDTSDESGVKREMMLALLSDFGLLGKWAVDCNEEASPENPFATYTIPHVKSYGTMEYFMGKRWRHDPYYLYSGERLSDTELLLNEEWAFDHQMRDIVIRRSKDRIRVLSARKQKDGTYTVENGIMKNRGRETSWMEKCSE